MIKFGMINPFTIRNLQFSLFPLGLIKKRTLAIQLPKLFFKSWTTPAIRQTYFQFIYLYVNVLTYSNPGVIPEIKDIMHE